MVRAKTHLLNSKLSSYGITKLVSGDLTPAVVRSFMPCPWVRHAPQKISPGSFGIQFHGLIDEIQEIISVRGEPVSGYFPGKAEDH